MTERILAGDRLALAESEIEVTSAMIEAGKDEIASRWVEFTSDDDEGPRLWGEVLTAVYRAMTAARPKFGL